MRTSSTIAQQLRFEAVDGAGDDLALADAGHVAEELQLVGHERITSSQGVPPTSEHRLAAHGLAGQVVDLVELLALDQTVGLDVGQADQGLVLHRLHLAAGASVEGNRTCSCRHGPWAGGSDEVGHDGPPWARAGVSGLRRDHLAQTQLLELSRQTADMGEPVASATIEELTGALTGVIAKGLPVVHLETAGLLLELRSVYARAVIPSEERSRLAALNELLPRLVATISDGVYREAVQMLFGLAPGTRGTTLSARRRQAAKHLDYSEGHFRNEKEAELLEAVAVALHDDLLRYRSRINRASQALEPTGDTPRLGPEHITHEEELVSRIWQHVYGLRAELIAVGRLSEQEGLASQVEDHRQAAVREEEALQGLLGEYRETYGEELIRHGEVGFVREALERLAGWTG
jgi:hypothetical protein